MPTFVRKRDHGPPDLSWWNSTPTTGPTGTATTWVGIQFTVDVSCKLTGLAFYDGFAAPNTVAGDYCFGQAFTNGSGGNPLCIGKFVAKTSLSNRWNFIWFHPQPILSTGVTYFAAVLYCGGGFFRNNNFLPAPGTLRNHIRMMASFQSTALDLVSAAITTNLNANAVDPLIRLI